ncbi:MAG: hypothetical protein IT395_02385, partial [Candidatus Omnitrophica bacterium]|nr:hypothetical protein [Candidatus Omnitrophota bacterium]
MTDTEIYDHSSGASRRKIKSALTADLIRDKLIQFSKDFKTSWVNLGQNLYPVYKDKLFHA